MKKCRLKQFLIFIFSAFCVGVTSVGVYAQYSAASQVNMQARLLLQAKLLGKKLTKEDLEEIKDFQDYLLKDFKEFDVSDPEVKPKQLDFKDYEEEADRLFVAIYNFVNKTNAEGITAENFNDYVKKYMEESGGPMTCLSRQEFDDKCNRNYTMKKFYRGINNLEYVKNFRNGVPYIGGTVRGGSFDDEHGSMYGHCVYATADKSLAECYARTSKQQKNDKIGLQWLGICQVGGVIEMAIDMDEIKYVIFDHLNKVRKTLLYYYPIIGNAYRYFNSRARDWDICGFAEDEYHNKIKSKAFKEVFGFETEKLPSHINPDYKNLDEKEKKKFRNKLSNLKGALIRFPDYAGKVNELYSCNQIKPHFVDKYCAVLNDEGLLAKLMGKDVIFTDFDTNGNIDFDRGICLIVNPGVINVCNDDSQDSELNLSFEPTVENLQKLFNKDNER